MAEINGVLDEINQYRIENGYAEIAKIDDSLSELAAIQAKSLEETGLLNKTAIVKYVSNDPIWISLLKINYSEVECDSWFNLLVVDNASIGIAEYGKFWLVIVKEDKKKEEPSVPMNWLAGILKPIIDWFGGK